MLGAWFDEVEAAQPKRVEDKEAGARWADELRPHQEGTRCRLYARFLGGQMSNAEQSAYLILQAMEATGRRQRRETQLVAWWELLAQSAVKLRSLMLGH